MPNPVVVRLSTPAQVVAALPLHLGYRPSESLVVVCQQEPRGRIGLTMRFDLPDLPSEQSLVEDVVTRVRLQQASRVLLVVYTDEEVLDGLPRTGLVAALLSALGKEGSLTVSDALVVVGNRFWSYECVDVRCCPPEGLPVGDADDDEEVGLLAAELALKGKAVLPSREALEASLAGPVLLAAEAARQRCEQAFADLVEAREAGRRDDYLERMAVLWLHVAGRFSLPRPVLDGDEAAALAVSLGDKLLRDVVITRHDSPGMRELLVELCRRTPAPWDVPVCSAFAYAAYCDGAGAEVSIALERALTSEPDYELARLVRDALLQQADPSLLREIARQLGGGDRLSRWAV
jgi:hypothetical protein